MPTSLVSTGVQFPDSTIQTTAASAGGTVTGTASGSISTGAPVVINSDGTISVVTATGSATFTTGTYAQTLINSNVGNPTISFDSARNVVVLFYVRSADSYVYGIVGVMSGTSITWGTPTLITNGVLNYSGSPNNRMQSVYAANVGIHACFSIGQYNNTYYMFFAKVGSNNTITSTGYQSIATSMSGSYFYYPSATYDTATSRIALICMDPFVAQSAHGFCGSLNSSGVLTLTPFTLATGITTQGADTSITTTSTGKVIFYFQGTSDYPQAVIAQLPSSGNTLTNVSSIYNVNTVTQNNNLLAVGIDSSTGNALFTYVTGVGGNNVIKVASISGYTLSFGSASASIGVPTSATKYLKFFQTPGTNATLLIYDSNSSSPMYGLPITVSGLTITTGSVATVSGGSMGTMTVTTDPIGLQYVLAGTYGVYFASNTFTNVTTNLTSTNFLGFSSASYTNGQTATINIVSSTNSSQSGLTAGSKYYVLGGGTLSSGATSNPYAGLARSSTSILVKG